MAISTFLQPANLGTRISQLTLADSGVLAPSIGSPAGSAPAAAPGPPPGGLMTDPGILTAVTRQFPPPNILPSLLQPIDFFPPAPPKITTALTLAAIDQLNRATPTQVRQAINALVSLQLAADGVMDFLTRRTKISEVLGQSADHWVPTTQTDFGNAFNVQLGQPDTTAVMDSIVSIAVLNDRDLETELRSEHAPPGTPADFLQNRRVIWQWPPPGSVLSPPYVILVAVESQNTAAATDIVQTILGQLAVFQGYKLPHTVIQKLG